MMDASNNFSSRYKQHVLIESVGLFSGFCQTLGDGGVDYEFIVALKVT